MEEPRQDTWGRTRLHADYGRDSTGLDFAQMLSCGASLVRTVPGRRCPLLTTAPLQNVQAGSPMQVVTVDILGPLPKSSYGNQYILVAGDYFKQWMEAYAIPNQEANVPEILSTRPAPFRPGTAVQKYSSC